MRYYDNYGRPLAEVAVGEDSVAITHASGTITTADIIRLERDDDGRIVYAMLDRKVHGDYDKYEGWMASGCYVTELHRERSRDDLAVTDSHDAVRDQVEHVLTETWPERYDLYGLIADLARHIETQDKLVNFWRREVLLDDLCGHIVQALDSRDLDEDLDRLETVARRIIGRCKELLG